MVRSGVDSGVNPVLHRSTPTAFTFLNTFENHAYSESPLRSTHYRNL